MKSKQTAVLFLQEALELHLSDEQKSQFCGLFVQAVESEKCQIIDAVNYTVKNCQELSTYNNCGEYYYNKNYDIHNL